MVPSGPSGSKWSLEAGALERILWESGGRVGSGEALGRSSLAVSSD